MIPKIQNSYFALIGEHKASRGQRFAKFLNFERIRFYNLVERNSVR